MNKFTKAFNDKNVSQKKLNEIRKEVEQKEINKLTK